VFSLAVHLAERDADATAVAAPATLAPRHDCCSARCGDGTKARLSAGADDEADDAAQVAARPSSGTSRRAA
jgi:hypothetical protein